MDVINSLERDLRDMNKAMKALDDALENDTDHQGLTEAIVEVLSEWDDWLKDSIERTISFVEDNHNDN